jgi:hypothetical protein
MPRGHFEPEAWKVYRLVVSNENTRGTVGEWLNYYATSTGRRYYIGFNLTENRFRDGTDERRLDQDPNGVDIRTFIRLDVDKVRRQSAKLAETPF